MDSFVMLILSYDSVFITDVIMCRTLSTVPVPVDIKNVFFY